MRRALRKQLPALTRVYGLRPHELDAMTYGEINEYLDQLAAMAKTL